MKRTDAMQHQMRTQKPIFAWKLLEAEHRMCAPLTAQKDGIAIRTSG